MTESSSTGEHSDFDLPLSLDDSDADGVLDGVEVAAGMNPLSADSDGDDVCDGGIAVGGSCNTAGPEQLPTDCDVRDLYVLERHLQGASVTVENACDAWLGL